MEATVLVYDASFPYCPFSLDNSDWSRNGDYHPNRFDAQREAAMSIFSAKTREHVESAVGIVLMAAEARLHETHSSSTLLVAPTGNLRLFESSLLGKKARISGSGNVLGALRQAQVGLVLMRDCVASFKAPCKSVAAPAHYFVCLQPCV